MLFDYIIKDYPIDGTGLARQKDRAGTPEGQHNNNTNNNKRDGDAIASPTSEVKIIIDYFFDECVKRLGWKPRINGGREGKMIKSLLKDLSVGEIKEMIDWFLESNNKKRMEHGTTLSVCLSANTVNLWQTRRSQDNWRDE